MQRVIKFLSTAAGQISTKQTFFEVAKFPNVLGAVDGTHVAVKVSDDDKLLSKHVEFAPHQMYYFISVVVLSFLLIRST